jgi:CRISPR-associated protein Csm2
MRIIKDDLKKIIIGGDTRILVERSQEFGSDLAKDLRRKDQRGRERLEISKLTTSQIRNFFGTVKKIEARGKLEDEEVRELLLLKPKLAYAAKKAGKTKLTDLKDVLTDSIDMVTSDDGNKQEKFNNFCDLFESILCYHKASGGY